MRRWWPKCYTLGRTESKIVLCLGRLVGPGMAAATLGTSRFRSCSHIWCPVCLPEPLLLGVADAVAGAGRQLHNAVVLNRDVDVLYELDSVGGVEKCLRHFGCAINLAAFILCVDRAEPQVVWKGKHVVDDVDHAVGG